MFFKFVPRRKTKMTWCGCQGERERESRIWEWWWLTSRGAVIKHQCVHLSCSWEEVLPLPPCLHASLLPNQEKDSILGLPACPLRRGLGRKIWPTPSVPVHLWTAVKKRPCNQCEQTQNAVMMGWWRSKMMTSQPWNSRNVYEMDGALMGWPQTRCCVHCWNYHWTKHSDGDLSQHAALLSAYTGRRCMVIITPAYYGWMRSFTEGGDDPIINFSNKTPFPNLGLPTPSSSLTHSFVFHRHPKSPITEAWVA